MFCSSRMGQSRKHSGQGSSSGNGPLAGIRRRSSGGCRLVDADRKHRTGNPHWTTQLSVSVPVTALCRSTARKVPDIRLLPHVPPLFPSHLTVLQQTCKAAQAPGAWPSERESLGGQHAFAALPLSNLQYVIFP